MKTPYFWIGIIVALVLGLIVGMLVFGVPKQTPSTTTFCSDADKGIDLFVKESCSSSNSFFSDTCIDSNKVKEGFCLNDNSCSTITMICPSGYVCSEGKCMVSNQTNKTNLTIIMGVSSEEYDAVLKQIESLTRQLAEKEDDLNSCQEDLQACEQANTTSVIVGAPFSDL